MVAEEVNEAVSIPDLEKFRSHGNFKNNEWGYYEGIMDSGATIHICGVEDLFTGKLQRINVKVKCANGEQMVAKFKGDLNLIVAGRSVILNDVYFIPGAPMLISVPKLVKDRKIGITMWGDDCSIFDQDKKVFLTIKNGLYGSKNLFKLPFAYNRKAKEIKIENDSNIEYANFVVHDKFAPVKFGVLSQDLLHERYNHLSKAYLKALIDSMSKHENIRGERHWCDACVVGGLPATRYSKKTSRSSSAENKLFRRAADDEVIPSKVNEVSQNVVNSVKENSDLICCEAKDSMVETEVSNFVYGGKANSNYGKSLACDTKVSPIISVRNYKYAFVVVCKRTKICIPMMGALKSDFVKLMKLWLKQYKNQYGKYPDDIHFDQGGEFTSAEFTEWLKGKGIYISFSATNEHNQNPHVERRIGIVWIAMLKALAHSGVPFQFWCYAFEYVTVVGNHIPNRSLQGKCAIDAAGFKTLHKFIRVFGCEVGYLDPRRLAHEAVGLRGIFLGVDPEIRGYRVLDILSRQVVVSRNVWFNEACYPFIQVMKPCLIMLKFGTWPETSISEYARKELARKNPIITSELSIMRNGGIVVNDDLVSKNENSDDNLDVNPFPSEISTEKKFTSEDLVSKQSKIQVESKYDDKDQSAVLDNGVVLKHLEDKPVDSNISVTNNDSSANGNISKEPMVDPKMDVNLSGSGIVPPKDSSTKKFLSDMTTPGLSPIFGDNSVCKDSKISRWPYIDTTVKALGNNRSFDSEGNVTPVKLNLQSPELNKGAMKRFEKFSSNYYGDNLYLKTMNPIERAKYNAKLRKASNDKGDGSKPRAKFVEGKFPTPIKPVVMNTAPPTPAPDGEINGVPAWNISEVKNVRIKNGVREYYVRWESGYKDEWLPEYNLEGCDELLERFNKKNKKPTIDVVPKVKDKPERTVPDHVKERLKVHQGLRRSARLNQVSADDKYLVNYVDTIFVAKNELQKFETLVNQDTDSDVDFDSVQDSESDSDVDNVNIVSTEIPPPVIDNEHKHYVGNDVSFEQCIAYALDSIESVLDGTNIQKPKNQAEARSGPFREEFIEAEVREIGELVENGTFKVTICPDKRKPITCRWVYDIKRNDKNEVVRYKARLVVQGFKQVEGIDFQRTFSSVAQMRTFRTIVALSIRFNWRITQYDIANAFLNADIDTEIYMTYPPGYPPKSKNPKQVFQLLKGLYGLKQASRLWNEKLIKVFNEAGLQVCRTESGVLFARSGTNLCLINLHVDDYCIATGDEDLRVKIEKVMAKNFKVTPLGELRLYLGIVHDRIDASKTVDGRPKAKLHQGPYHERALEKIGYDKASTEDSPANPSQKLSITDCPGEGVEKPSWPYMSVGGTYMYSACGTRPDLAQRVNQCARFNKNPGDIHVKAHKHLAKYLKGTKGRGCVYTRPKNWKESDKVQVVAFCDSDWAGCIDTRRSTVGWVVMICNGPVSWKSQLKKTLALSSCEAEFMALSDVAREIAWFCRFFDEVGIEYEVPCIYTDSRSAICWAEDPVQHQRNKHVELKYYYIRDQVARRLVKVLKINTKFNPADPLTKPCTKVMAKSLIPVLMGEEEPTFEE